jgi:hypothetical protein
MNDADNVLVKVDDINIIVDDDVDDDVDDKVVDKVVDGSKNLEVVSVIKEIIPTISSMIIDYIESKNSTYPLISNNKYIETDNSNKLILSLDTIFRSNSDTTLSNDFIYELPVEINNVKSMTLNVTEIPNTIFYFSSKNLDNTFSIKMDLVDNDFITETYSKDIIIPDGSWNTSDLAFNINMLFDIDRTLLSYLFFFVSNSTGRTYLRFKTIPEMFYWNESYGKSRFEKFASDVGLDFLPIAEFDLSIDVLQQIKYSVDFNPSNLKFQKSLAWKMGFRKFSKYTNITFEDLYNEWGKTYNGVIVTDSFYGESMDDYIFVVVDDFHNNYNDTIICSLSNTYMSSRILARVQFKSSTLSINYDNGPLFKTRRYTSPIKITKLHIKLINKYGDLIDLGKTSDFSMVFTFEQK